MNDNYPDGFDPRTLDDNDRLRDDDGNIIEEVEEGIDDDNDELND